MGNNFGHFFIVNVFGSVFAAIYLGSQPVCAESDGSPGGRAKPY